ncbi:MAG: O-antigen ligase family protein, partial [Pseudorhodoplanes sp.]|nr:O-antigen ligase family protein [Pseudorhodoplanes sp.]
MTLALKPNAAQRESLMRIADWLVVGIAVALPWSTSATIIGVALWALAVIPTIEPQDLKREMSRPAALLPVALFALAVIGMLWSPVILKERIGGLDSFLKILTIPLLFIQFRRSERGHWVLGGFLLSGLLLLATSGLSMVAPTIGGRAWSKSYGLPVKDYIAQSAVFTICAFGVFYLAIDAFRLRWRFLGAVLVVLGLLFLADMFFVVTSRTALLTIPFLLVLIGIRQFGWKGTVAVCIIGGVVAAAVWAASPNVRQRLGNLFVEVEAYRTSNEQTSAGQRVDFWTRAAKSIADAPVLGHGTGSIRESFRRTAVGHGPSSLVPVNPHNQILAVGIQLGFVGVFLLIAFWISHFALFLKGTGIVSWV